MHDYSREKHTPFLRSSLLRRLFPRHARAYLWITFLVLVFGGMILTDNGISLYDLLCAPWLDDSYTTRVNATQAPYRVEEPGVASSKEQLYTAPPKAPQASQAPQAVQGNQQRPMQDAKPVFGSDANAFSPDDVVILFKTGATSLWRRVPIHLSTSLANSSLTPNIAFYSDNADRIASHPIIDVLANVSSTLKSSPDFTLYTATKEALASNLYLEAAAMDGDHYLPGGWRLDKYKFLPLAQHAAANYPDKKWYVYMEDDNYFFWHSLYAWLATFDPSKPHFLGSPAARLGEDFAHGGSGFALSGAAMRQTFGAHPDLADRFEGYAQERCCGDQVLSHALAEHGVARDRRYDHTEWAGLQALPTWRMGFGAWNWCSPLFNVHKTHQADVSRLWNFERARAARHGERAVLRYRDVFAELVRPALTHERAEWDNEAAEKWFASGEADRALAPAERERKPWFSKKSCAAACDEWAECLSWKYADDQCALSSTAAQGRRIEAGIRMDSGWMLSRIDGLQKKECPSLGY
jgi:hypothetical protein